VRAQWKRKAGRAVGRRQAGLRAVAGQCGGKERREEALLGCQWAAREGEKRKKRLGLCWAE